MKTVILFFLSILFILPSCTQVADSKNEKADVTQVVKEFYQSFEQKDINLMSELMAHDTSMLSYGTAVSDIHKSWSEWKQNHLTQFKAIDEAKINSKNLHVYISQKGDVSWFADVSDWTLVIQKDTIQLKDIRITGVLEKRNKVWKIVQIHASVPQR